MGEYTLEELNVAVGEMQAGRLPRKVYVLFKEPAENISADLARLKSYFSERYQSIPVDTFDSSQSLRTKVADILMNSIHLE